WDCGTVGPWDRGTVGPWDRGTVGTVGPWDRGTVGPWDPRHRRRDLRLETFIVCDTHHGGGNSRLDAMLADPRVTYLQKPRGFHGAEFRWLPGLDGTVDAFLLPGHHAKAGTKNAFLPHTWTCVWADFGINGRSVGEIGIETCYR
ncbi:MAG: M55 family metallopeptidase, partial [Kiritimatiellae bacterium]|nr:M55 family metallopeptidase [Kiritimatiellia bacterium]